MWNVMRHRGFLTVWTGQVISLIGSRLYHVCLLAYIYQLSDSAVNVGVMLTWLTLPTFVLGPFAGILADRYSRRSLMIAADCLRAVASLCLWAFPGLRTAFAVSAVMGVGQALFNPAWTAAIPDLVSGDQLFSANAAWAVGRRLAHILGPTAAAAVIATGDAHTGFLVNAVSFLAGVACVAAVRFPRAAPPSARRNVLAELGEVAGAARARPLLLWVAGLTVVHGLMSGVNNVIIIPFVYDHLGRGGPEFGLLVTAFAVGLFAGSFALGAIGQRAARWPLIWAALSAMGLGQVWLGLCHGLWSAAAARVFIGAGDAAFNLGATTLIQARVPAALRGRVIGTMRSLEEALLLLGLTVGGVVATAWSAAQVYIGLGALVFVVALAASPARDPGAGEYAQPRRA
jgi:MFS family permease